MTNLLSYYYKFILIKYIFLVFRLPSGSRDGRRVCCILTLDDGQKDYDDEEEEGDVENDAVDLVLIARRVLNLVADPSACSDANIHMEHVTLDGKEGRKREKVFLLQSTVCHFGPFNPERISVSVTNQCFGLWWMWSRENKSIINKQKAPFIVLNISRTFLIDDRWRLRPSSTSSFR